MRTRVDRIMAVVFPLVLLALGVLFYYINPLMDKYPVQCPWRWCTGTLCPGCGLQRALHALVRGEVMLALRYNYFFVLSVPYALAAVLACWYNFGGRLDWLRRLVFHPITLKAYVIIFFAWWILRNVFHL